MTYRPLWSCYPMGFFFFSWSVASLKAEWKLGTSFSAQIKDGRCLGRCPTCRNFQKPTFLWSFHTFRQSWLPTKLTLKRRLEAQWMWKGVASRETEGASIGWSPSSACPKSPEISKSKRTQRLSSPFNLGSFRKWMIFVACPSDD